MLSRRSFVALLMYFRLAWRRAGDHVEQRRRYVNPWLPGLRAAKARLTRCSMSKYHCDVGGDLDIAFT
jgi:hypothetical protein